MDIEEAKLSQKIVDLEQQATSSLNLDSEEGLNLAFNGLYTEVSALNTRCAQMGERIRVQDASCVAIERCIGLVDALIAVRQVAETLNAHVESQEYPQCVELLDIYEKQNQIIEAELAQSSATAHGLGCGQHRLIVEDLKEKLTTIIVRSMDRDLQNTVPTELYQQLGIVDKASSFYVKLIKKQLAEFKLVSRQDVKLHKTFHGIISFMGTHKLKTAMEKPAYLAFLGKIQEVGETHGVSILTDLLRDLEEVTGEAQLDDLLSQATQSSRLCLFFQQFLENEMAEVSLTKLVHKRQELLNTYVQKEVDFLNNRFRLIVASDEIEGKTSTAVEHAFWLFQKVMSRAVSSGDVHAVCGLLNHVEILLREGFTDFLKTCIQESAEGYSVFLQDERRLASGGSLESTYDQMAKFRETAEPGRGGARHVWPVAMNNLETCIQLARELRNLEELPAAESFRSETGFSECLNNYDLLSTEWGVLMELECKQGLGMLKRHLSPYLKKIEDCDFEMDEKGYTDFQVNGTVIPTFLIHAGRVFRHLNEVLLPKALNRMILVFASQANRRLESICLDKQFSLYGGLQIADDVRKIYEFCASILQNEDQLTRESLVFFYLNKIFVRTREICAVLTLESRDELNVTSFNLLSPAEIEEILEARRDI